jgi:hypothetical protein
MKKIIVFIAFICLSSCKQSISNANLHYLNGYWEIEKVALPNGEKKAYKINETIDFFKIDTNKGFRKKVTPQLDGTYLTNDHQEEVVIIFENGEAIIQYKTKYASWNENIIELTKDKLVLKNQQDLEYHYKRPTKFSIK